MQVILNHQQVQQKITRLGHELLENCFEEKSICIGGIHGNGYALAQTIGEIISSNSNILVDCFEIQINKTEPWKEDITVNIDDKKLKKGYVIIVDDVINSGKTMQYALVKILEKPTKIIRTMVLVDRKHRRYPIKADIVGISLSTTLKDRVEVDLNKEDSKAYLV